MTDLSAWNNDMQQELADIQRRSRHLAATAAKVRGRGEVRGITVEVDPGGDITRLSIAPGMMRGSAEQLTAALLECHRRARQDAAARTQQILDKADPQLRIERNKLLSSNRTAPAAKAMTEAEIQAADDAYFARINGTTTW
jgi:DNA-binding protein YbaB